MDYMTTAEVADYLRLKERKVYELATTGRIPCARVTGKWLFPKRLIDQWVLGHVEFSEPGVGTPPPVLAGSHDPLLDWAVRESGCDLALMTGGSADGLARLLDGRAVVAGLHLIDPASGGYNAHALKAACAPPDVVLIQWARRVQGLIVAPGNPHGLTGLADVAAKGLRLAQRQEGAGAQALLRFLSARDGVPLGSLDLLEPPARSEGDLAGLVADGAAQCGIGIEAVARRLRLDFVPLHRERYDLALRRRDYFDPAFQRLLNFARAPAFAERAARLGGYDVSGTGSVSLNP